MWESCWNRKLTVDARNTELYGYWNQPIEEEAYQADAAAAASTYADNGWVRAGPAARPRPACARQQRRPAPCCLFCDAWSGARQHPATQLQHVPRTLLTWPSASCPGPALPPARSLSYTGSAANGSVNGKVKLSAAAEAAVSDIIAQAEATAHVAVPAMAGAAVNGGSHKVRGQGRGT